MNSVNIAAFVLRLAVGGTMIAHGWNHAFGGGKLPGTARWFESIGIRPGRVHALAATVTELSAGALLVLGLLTPLAAAGVVGTMVVALVANHARNGFFIFRPGEGFEYVLMITLVSCALGALGSGRLVTGPRGRVRRVRVGWPGHRGAGRRGRCRAAPGHVLAAGPREVPRSRPRPVRRSQLAPSHGKSVKNVISFKS